MSQQDQAEPEQARQDEQPAPVYGKSLGRFRVMAYVVGVGLLALVAAMVMRYGFGDPQYVGIIGPAHGFLYAVYLLFAFDLAMKGKWSIKGTLLVLLAGTIPFVSFFAEKAVSRRVLAGERL